MSKDELYMSVCPRCGDVDDDVEICSYCGTKHIRTKYTFMEMLEDNGINDEQIVNEYARCSPLFDEDLYLSRTNKEKLMAQATMDKQQQANKPKCPTCNSTNIEKISATSKAVGFITIGVFSKSFGKTFHCKNCGYRW